MNKEQFEKLKVGDNVVVNGNTRIRHDFEKGTHITVTKISMYGDVYGHNEYGLGQWVVMEDIEYENKVIMEQVRLNLDILFKEWKAEIYKRYEPNHVPYLTKGRKKMRDRYKLIKLVLDNQLNEDEIDFIISCLEEPHYITVDIKSIVTKLEKQKDMWRNTK